ncbi:MAG: hypothetical protein NUV65_06945 [Candidatus Roizmanbacteria bacterium]|nr:hypothetical protein [Candidatus Roizmanbacteria bacterium]
MIHPSQYNWLTRFIGKVVDIIRPQYIKTVEYTVGVGGSTEVDYTFDNTQNNMTIQGIQLGGTAIIPANSIPTAIIIKCTEDLSTGAATGQVSMGTASGGAQFRALITCDDAGEYSRGVVAATFSDSLMATDYSVYFNVTPNTNWDDASMTTGKWKIWITYVDNSIL